MTCPKFLSLSAALLVALVIAFLSVPADGKSTKAAPKSARLFDHKRHQGVASVKCSQCHIANDEGKWNTIGKKEHARCFTCHKFSSSCGTLAQKEGKVCLSCHTTFQSRCTPKGYTAPKLGGLEFSAKYSHKIHARTRAKSGAQCEGCHGKFGQTAPGQATLSVGHALCSGCHARGTSPLLRDACEGCHVSGKSQASSLPSSLYSVSGRFDHKAHASIRRVGTEGRDCLVCHSNIKDASSDAVIPMPTMAGCLSSCHDGKKAFDALGTSCTRCHSKGSVK